MCAWLVTCKVCIRPFYWPHSALLLLAIHVIPTLQIKGALHTCKCTYIQLIETTGMIHCTCLIAHVYYITLPSPPPPPPSQPSPSLPSLVLSELGISDETWTRAAATFRHHGNQSGSLFAPPTVSDVLRESKRECRVVKFNCNTCIRTCTCKTACTCTCSCMHEYLCDG